MPMKNKRELILNTMESFFQEGLAGTVSVSDIAKRAGIAKGGIYYYFHSKEEIMDAVVNRQYDTIIEHVKVTVTNFEGNAIEKLALLLFTYKKAYVDPSLDEYLHMPYNAALHQKSLATILTSLKPLVTTIFEQGISEGIFSTNYPAELAEILLSSFTFLHDPGIFDWTPEEMSRKMQATAEFLALTLHTPENAFQFLYKN